jgi:HEAT repeat protein
MPTCLGLFAVAACAIVGSSRQSEPSILDLLREIPRTVTDDPGTDPVERDLELRFEALGPKAIPLLLRMLRSPRPGFRKFASDVLCGIDGLGEEHLEALIRARLEGDDGVPSAIGRIGTPAAIAFLVDDLVHDPSCGTQVTSALERLGPKASVALAVGLDRPDPVDDGFIACACEIFVVLGDDAAAAIDPLLEIALSTSRDRDHRRQAIQLLGTTGPAARRTIPALQSLAEADPCAFASVVDQAFVDLGVPEAVPVLVRRLRAVPNGWTFQDLAALRENGREAGAFLETLLVHEQPNVRVCAARTLGFIGASGSSSALVRCLADADDWQLVYVAADSLGRLRARSAFDPLERTANSHWFPPVRDAARRALAAIGGADPYPPPSDPRSIFREFDEYESEWRTRRVTEEPLPAFVVDPDELTPDELASTRYEGEIVTASGDACGPDGRCVERVEQRPNCGLRVGRVVLLGSTRGEWGGELVAAAAGAPTEFILRENVQGVHAIPSGIVAVTGLCHLGFDFGALYRIDLRPDGRFEATWWKRLPGKPSDSGVLPDGSLFVRCHGGDVVVAADGSIGLEKDR